MAALKQHKARRNERRLKWGEAWQETAFVFDRGGGSLLHPNVVDSTFRRLSAALNLPRIRFHDLRHTAATLMLAEGVHPKIIQERLGHSDISMTLNRYSHVSMDMQRGDADTVDRLLGS